MEKWNGLPKSICMERFKGLKWVAELNLMGLGQMLGTLPGWGGGKEGVEHTSNPNTTATAQLQTASVSTLVRPFLIRPGVPVHPPQQLT